MEAWLASIDSRVIDAWLAFAKVEPAAFGFASNEKSADNRNIQWFTADKAENFFAQRFGGG